MNPPPEAAEKRFGRGLFFLRSQFGLILFTLLNYLDKLLIFLTPLAVLYVHKDKGIYNEVEYIYSIAAVAAVPIEFGIANYFLFAYRESVDRPALVHRAHCVFLFSFAIYTAAVAIGAATGHLVGISSIGLVLLVAIRALFVYFLQFYTVYFRVVDRPAMIFAFSCLANVATLAVVLAMRLSAAGLNLGLFFAAQAVIPLAIAGYHLRAVRWPPRAELTGYVTGGLRYAWPISLNILLFMVVNNYGKVYAQNWLSADDMFHISFVQRLALIIQLAHTSAIGYLAKSVFVDEGAASERRMLVTYSVMLTLATVGVVLVFGLLRMVRGAMVPVGFDAVTVSVVAYTVLWCYSAFFELYLNKLNRNKAVLLVSLASALLFGALLGLEYATPLRRIALAMVGSGMLKLVLTMEILRRSRAENVADR